MISIKKICKVCGKEFVAHNGKSKYCSLNCSKVYYSQITFKDSNPDEYVECKICGFRSKQIYRHIESAHKMSVDEYCCKFNLNEDDLICKASHKSMSSGQKLAYAEGRSVGWGFGDKNPAKSSDTKNGRNSAWSMNFKGYDGLSDDEKRIKIKELSNKVVDRMNSSQNNPLRIDYYTSRGYSESEAQEMLKDRQSTFSLKKCIEKYGEEEGTHKFNERQEKWQHTLNSKSPEEIERINKAKMLNGKGYSNISQKLFDEILNEIKDEFKDIFYATVNGKSKDNFDEYVVYDAENKVRFFLDFYIKDNNKVIEFDGDYWHSEKRGNQERDRLREQKLIQLGYTNILHVKERDYKQDPKKVIEECLKFIRN